ncbi:MAG: tetratricopeptide repeat protein, partial [Cyanobacteria bacterium HKST-UBA01]|nr:tetratricopeptide repeat protein [Cyanobacteria bacterium HKST-UBA01]
YFVKTLTRMEQTLGSNHPDVGYTSYCLGATYHWKSMPSRAESYYKKALSIKEEQLGLKHHDLATILEPLIDVLNSQGKQAEAGSYNRRMNELTGYDR